MTGRLRHGARIEAVRAAAAGGAPGATDGAMRRAAYDAVPVPDPLGPYLDKVRDAAWSVTDADVARLKEAGYPEDAILELTIAAAAGAAGRGYDAAVRALHGEA